MIPKKLGPYLVEEILGRGGMGTVYRGTDPSTGEQVALKVLSPDLSADIGFLHRFQEEVETLLELKHPNIVQLLSFGKRDDLFYFAMELVEGKSLYAMQKAGYRFGYVQSIEIAIKVCEGLHHSHNLGIVHRDLKPGNIILADNGQIKLADYGIAKRFGGQQMTVAGVLGTAEFMAPEQAQGKPASVQSDLYGLGGVLFTLISGRPPFEELTPQKTLEKVVTTQPPYLTSISAGVPNELAAIVDKLLRKQPENRFRSAKSVAAKLAELLILIQERAEMETNVIPADEDFTTSSDTKRLPAVASSDNATIIEGAARQLTPANAKPPASASSKTVQQTRVAKDKKSKSKSSKSKARQSTSTTLEETENRSTLQPTNRVIRENDFFERAVVAEREEVNEQSSNLVTVLLAVGFLVVVLASSYLVYDRVVRDRTADELWTVIDAAVEKPQSVTKELDEFLRLYPEDVRGLRVLSLQQLAGAMQYRKTLALQAGLNRGEVMDVEKKFLQYTAENGESQFDKASLLSSLVVFYGTAAQDLDERTKECLNAAKVFRNYYHDASKGEVETKLKEITARIATAQRLESEDPAGAKQLRESLIELFGDKKWARALIDPLRE